MNITTIAAHQVVPPSSPQGAGPPVDARGVMVITVDGDIDLYSGPDLKRALAEVLASAGPGTDDPGRSTTSDTAPDRDGLDGSMWAVVVDLSEVEFIDSYAVGVLVQGHHLARRSGRAYALVATHPMIHTLFEITGLARVLPLHADVASAVASLHVAQAATLTATRPAETADEAPG
ncbi:STAS domain-containing protein [Quadrisphaera sp. KR29]|uniref:STAS domain-containing protein n=1 Tax=Quadrisphaera sp. KR29 TaxID=3461391 RepID=UPI004043D578